MFKFNVHSNDFADAMRKISIAIPPAQKENDCIKIALFKKVKAVNKSVAILLAFDGKVQAVSSMDIQDVVADVDELEVHVNGKKVMATAAAYAAMETVLEVTLDKEMKISGAGSHVTLQLGQEIAALKSNEPLLQEVEMETEEFVQFANFASSCFGEEKGSRGLHCVGIKISEEDKKMIGVSSNGMRCAYAETQKLAFKQIKQTEESENSRKDTVVIEGKQLKNAVRNLWKKKVQIGIDSKRIRIKSGTDVIMILTQDITFPMAAVLQAVGQCEKVGAWKAPLAKVFQAISIFEITMETAWMEIQKNGESQVSLQGKDEQTSAAVICAQEGNLKNIVVDEKEFKNALSVFSKEKDIIIETMSPKNPLVIRQHKDDPNRIILMPVVEE
ncbi:MAG: hypothetical protein PHW34_09155 [Hespellia sp.]|nr:hypothetical protein [Hespellia sp.]